MFGDADDGLVVRLAQDADFSHIDRCSQPERSCFRELISSSRQCPRRQDALAPRAAKPTPDFKRKAVRGADPVLAASADVQMVDTVGAGDSFMAGLLSDLLDAGEGARVKLGQATPGNVLAAVRRAIATSGVTVSRAGAYAPTRKELETVL